MVPSEGDDILADQAASSVRSVISQALGEDPPAALDPEFLALYGTACWGAGRIGESLAADRLCLRGGRIPQSVHFRAGFWALHQGREALALRHFARFAEADPDNAAALLGIAYAFFYAEEYSTAAGVFRRLEREQPRLWSPAAMAAACEALAVGRTDVAVELPPLPDLPAGVADVLQIRLLHGPGAAAEHASRLRAERPHSLPLARIRCELLVDEEDFPGADAEAARALRRWPDDGVLWRCKGAVQSETEPSAALTSFTKAVELAPADPESRFGMAAVLRTLGRDTAAEAAYRIAIYLAPEERRHDVSGGSSVPGDLLE
ncbi:tetratricopeptide repeat protein [Microbispora bryophytorum]|uniref:tetratricopeptide repeat protein n=1 Tax=Microbispora bryophytorum TaxID=1460882 RepID=UPI0033F1E1F7